MPRRAHRSATVLAGTLTVLAALAMTACGDAADDRGDGATSTTVASRATDAPPGTAAPGPTTTAPLPEVRAVDLELGLSAPIDLTARPGSASLLVAERGGRIVEAVRDGDRFRIADRPVIDLTSRVGSTDAEKGLLGIAVAPDGRHLYASYTEAGNGDSRIDEYELSGRDGSLRADPATRRELFAAEQPYPNHNGGGLAVGPDGMLYAGFGDGGAANDLEGRAQDRSTPLGKILRLDPGGVNDANRDGVPDDNPFVAEPGADGRIWATGLRNPWRLSFDRESGDLWIGDVGQNEVEEVDVLRATEGGGRGANLGWDLFEGDQRFPDADPAPGAASAGPFVEPVHTYRHDDGGCSVTGGYVYRGSALPALSGTYLFSDFCLGGVRALRTGTDGRAEVTDLGVDVAGVASFGQDDRGELYVLNLDGTVARITGT